MQTETAVCIIFIPINFAKERLAFERKAMDCKMIEMPPKARIADSATPQFEHANESSLQPRVISIIPLDIPVESNGFAPKRLKNQAKKEESGKSILKFVKMSIAR